MAADILLFVMAHIGRNNLITRAEAAEQQDLRLRQEKQRRRDITAEVKALERTMDPILAPQVWNARNSCLLQLPNELLLPILKGVVVKSQDRRRISRVCRQLRQLVKEPSLKCGFWERTRCVDCLNVSSSWFCFEFSIHKSFGASSSVQFVPPCSASGIFRTGLR